MKNKSLPSTKNKPLVQGLLKKLLIGGGIGLGVGLLSGAIGSSPFFEMTVYPFYILSILLLEPAIESFFDLSGNFLNSIFIAVAWTLLGVMLALIWEKLAKIQKIKKRVLVIIILMIIWLALVWGFGILLFILSGYGFLGR